MSRYQLAQMNVANMKAPLESPVMADFVASLDRINALADRSPGFVWRLIEAEPNETVERVLGKTALVNMSVWTDVKSLNAYAYQSPHVEIMRRRREWFDRMPQASLVLWWVPAGHRPSLEEAVARLQLIREKGPTPQAFHFGKAWPAPDAPSPESSFAFGDECPAT